ncbi:p-cumate 2,3-dioxygenase beta subunit [Pseudonocardia sediminis]|uniref:p-cumate 2,3-dioxygenase beta subunit n=1 Tax=Pseudonocardia sediminis TaxID=1397368 RepID=A0A4Q7UZQ1_PSEST|nr:aromatic-ring-hydroxylating dioxygenase subunit beta [Pseudonocardia sediminis]RZT85773.1 p-cumate 2,3-dioxygenase beta subunit [Pseudonocardia sediminis]
MSAPARVRRPTRSEVEDLLFAEAELLDAWDLDTWLTLYTSDSRYVVPATDVPDGDPTTDLVLIDDDRLRMTLRVERLNSRKAHREYPHSKCRHLVTNVRVGEPDGDEIPVRASFIVWRTRNGKDSTWVGGYTYRLVERDGALRIRSKRVELDMSSLRPANDVAVIL